VSSRGENVDRTTWSVLSCLGFDTCADGLGECLGGYLDGSAGTRMGICCLIRIKRLLGVHTFTMVESCALSRTPVRATPWWARLASSLSHGCHRRAYGVNAPWCASGGGERTKEARSHRDASCAAGAIVDVVWSEAG